MQVSQALKYSWSDDAGTSRWIVENISLPLVKAYLVDCKVCNLAYQFYMVGLYKDDNEGDYHIAAFPVEHADPDVDFQELIPNVLTSITKGGVCVQVIAVSEEVAREKFERIVSNIMHGRLIPHSAVQKFWDVLASE
jgi:hypothetical protein